MRYSSAWDRERQPHSISQCFDHEVLFHKCLNLRSATGVSPGIAHARCIRAGTKCAVSGYSLPAVVVVEIKVLDATIGELLHSVLLSCVCFLDSHWSLALAMTASPWMSCRACSSLDGNELCLHTEGVNAHSLRKIQPMCLQCRAASRLEGVQIVTLVRSGDCSRSLTALCKSCSRSVHF